MLTLISWNIQRGRGPDGRCSSARTVADLLALADPDVLCLQEVSAGYTDLAGCDGADQFSELARLLPGYTPAAAYASDLLGEVDAHGGAAAGAAAGACRPRRRFGCMILSRLPVLQVFRHSLPWPADPLVMSMQRVALEVTLDTPLGLLRVTTTHLEYFSALQRAAQVDRLREQHEEAARHARQPGPGGAGAGPFGATPRAAQAVLAGDFNFAPRSADYQRLLRRFRDSTRAYVDAWPLANGRRAHAPTVCLHDQPQRSADPHTSDFVFVSEDLARRVARLDVDAADFGPDHQPLLFRLA